MNRATKWTAGTVAAIAIVGGGAGVAVAGGNDSSDPTSDDVALTGATLEKASKAALDATGGGKVVSTEEGNEGIAYEVEVATTDGRTVEVQLDENFNVTHQEVDTPDQGGSED